MCSCKVFAQNATKAELNELKAQVNELSLKLNNLESTIERVVTENVNLVEQLNVKTVTSYTDRNQMVWDIVKVEPNPEENDVVVTLRLTNRSGVIKYIATGFDIGSAIDSNSNLNNNTYVVKIGKSTADLSNIKPGVPINVMVVIKGVPITCTYLSNMRIEYSGYKNAQNASVEFTGVHIPW